MLDQKQPENVEYFNYVGSMITNDTMCTHDIKYRIALAKAVFNKSRHFHEQIRNKLMEETN